MGEVKSVLLVFCVLIIQQFINSHVISPRVTLKIHGPAESPESGIEISSDSLPTELRTIEKRHTSEPTLPVILPADYNVQSSKLESEELQAALNVQVLLKNLMAAYKDFENINQQLHRQRLVLPIGNSPPSQHKLNRAVYKQVMALLDQATQEENTHKEKDSPLYTIKTWHKPHIRKLDTMDNNADQVTSWNTPLTRKNLNDAADDSEAPNYDATDSTEYTLETWNKPLNRKRPTTDDDPQVAMTTQKIPEIRHKADFDENDDSDEVTMTTQKIPEIRHKADFDDSDEVTTQKIPVIRHKADFDDNDDSNEVTTQKISVIRHRADFDDNDDSVTMTTWNKPLIRTKFNDAADDFVESSYDDVTQNMRRALFGDVSQDDITQNHQDDAKNYDDDEGVNQQDEVTKKILNGEVGSYDDDDAQGVTKKALNDEISDDVRSYDDYVTSRDDVFDEVTENVHRDEEAADSMKILHDEVSSKNYDEDFTEEHVQDEFDSIVQKIQQNSAILSSESNRRTLTEKELLTNYDDPTYDNPDESTRQIPTMNDEITHDDTTHGDSSQYDSNYDDSSHDDVTDKNIENIARTLMDAADYDAPQVADDVGTQTTQDDAEHDEVNSSPKNYDEPAHDFPYDPRYTSQENIGAWAGGSRDEIESDPIPGRRSVGEGDHTINSHEHDEVNSSPKNYDEPAHDFPDDPRYTSQENIGAWAGGSRDEIESEPIPEHDEVNSSPELRGNVPDNDEIPKNYDEPAHDFPDDPRYTSYENIGAWAGGSRDEIESEPTPGRRSVAGGDHTHKVKCDHDKNSVAKWLVLLLTQRDTSKLQFDKRGLPLNGTDILSWGVVPIDSLKGDANIQNIQKMAVPKI